MPLPFARRLREIASALALLPLAASSAPVAPVAAGVESPSSAAASATDTRTPNSAMDGQLFYQLFLSELELVRGEPGVSYQVMLDAAKRLRDESLYQRAVDIAVGARAGDQALAATKAWRSTLPRSTRAAELQAQLLMALGRPNEATEPIRALLDHTAESDRAAAIATLPRLVLAGQGKPAAATALDEALKPWRQQPATRPAAVTATARGWAIAGETAKGLEGVREVQKTEPGDEAAALLALDLMGKESGAESAVTSYLAARPDGHTVRLGYARRLTAAQRYAEALTQAQTVTRADGSPASAWMLEGALQIELGNPRAAQTALKRYLDVSRKTAPRGAAGATGADQDGEASGNDNAEESAQAYLMLAQSSEQLKDYAGAQAWLDQLGEAQSTPPVVIRRATLLARSGKVKEARALLQTLPERTPDEVRAKVLAETQMLRELRAWKDAYEVLERANARLPDDPDLLYEQALLAERLLRFDEMEKLLRRVIGLKPDQQHAYNALGYSLADRNIRLPEARELVQKALSLSPGDPFITDSLAWVEFRMGRKDAALALLKEAYGKRPDTEIGAHLGEVLWAAGQPDEARRVWRASQERDAGNEVLKDTLQRLKVRL